MELLKERLPNIGDSHLASNSDFHVNNLKYITYCRRPGHGP
jgi:hypothetical protein